MDGTPKKKKIVKRYKVKKITDEYHYYQEYFIKGHKKTAKDCIRYIMVT